MLLREVLRPVTMAAGVIAVVAKQSDSTAGAAAADQYRARSTKACSDPHDTKALDVAIAARYFDMTGEKAQTGDGRIFEADVGLVDLAGITRDDVAQVMAADGRHQFNGRPWFGMSRTTLSIPQLHRHSHLVHSVLDDLGQLADHPILRIECGLDHSRRCRLFVFEAAIAITSCR